MAEHTHRHKGLLLAATGASLWGINGAFADIVFSQLNAPVEWVVGTRLLLAGILLLLFARLIKKEAIFAIWRTPKDRLTLIAFGSLGMLACQYLFFQSIGANGAGLATILQFTSPIFIYLYLVIRQEKTVEWIELSYIFLTFVGVFLLVTKGSLSQLVISPEGLLLGLGSAIGVAFYTLQPRTILKKYGPLIVVGWGMMIGGIVLQFIHPIWQPAFIVDVKAMLYMAFIIVVGTALAFTLYLASVNYIEPSLSNITSALEPLVANVLTVFFLGQHWSTVQVLGIGLVIISVILFANHK